MQTLKNVAIRLPVAVALLAVGFSVRNANAVPAPYCQYQSYVTTSCQNNELCNTTWYNNIPANPGCPFKGSVSDCFWTSECSQTGDPDPVEPGE